MSVGCQSLCQWCICLCQWLLFGSFQIFSTILTKSVKDVFCLLVSDSPLHQCPNPPPLYTSCERNTFHPATSFPLHPSHVLKFISPYLSPVVKPLPSLHLVYLCAALLAQWQSHHTLSIRLLRPGRSAALHCTVPVWSHQCQSPSCPQSL